MHGPWVLSGHAIHATVNPDSRALSIETVVPQPYNSITRHYCNDNDKKDRIIGSSSGASSNTECDTVCTLYLSYDQGV